MSFITECEPICRVNMPLRPVQDQDVHHQINFWNKHILRDSLERRGRRSKKWQLCTEEVSKEVLTAADLRKQE